jgi:hypothetical protein
MDRLCKNPYWVTIRDNSILREKLFLYGEVSTTDRNADYKQEYGKEEESATDDVSLSAK